MASNLNKAVSAGYPVVRAASIQDNTKLIGRVNLNLGSSGSAGNTDTKSRLSNYKSNPNADPQLATLMFNFGRHSLVASSRDTGSLSLPANLQGIWNKDFSPAWGRYVITPTIMSTVYNLCVVNTLYVKFQRQESSSH